MAKSYYSLLFLCSLIVLVFPISKSQTSFRPKALVLKITKDTSTNQYLTTIPIGTPKAPIKLTVDLGGKFLWFDCGSASLTTNSSTRKPVLCRSAQCNLARSSFCEEDGACANFFVNPIINLGTAGNLFTDSAELISTNGANPGRLVSARNLAFTCAPSFILEGMRSQAIGIAGLGRINTALPALLSAAFSFPRKFAVCPSSTTGFVIFGDGPYVVSPGVDVSKPLSFTPILRNPVRFLDEEDQYYIGVRSVRVNGKTIPVNASLFSFDGQGNGGARFSTVVPYTTMETSIHNAVVNAFVAEMAARNVARVPAVSPFAACFAGKDIESTWTGPAVPPIELVLQNERTVWSIQGSNAMVRVSNEVLCLGIVDEGGLKSPRISIVIGGHQIEDNLIQVDLAASRLGFSSSLLARQTRCSNFNFTSIA